MNSSALSTTDNYRPLPELAIRLLLENSMTVAVVGASTNPDKASYTIPKILIESGFNVIPVHPTATEIHGIKVYSSIGAIPFPIDIVNVFRPSAEAGGIAHETAKIHAHALWLQLGISSDEARKTALGNNVVYIDDRCIGATVQHMGILHLPNTNQ